MEPCPYCSTEHAKSATCAGGAGRTDVLTMTVELAPKGETSDGKGWEFEGLSIPYGEELDRFDWLTGATRWTFEQGSVTPAGDAGADGSAMILFYGHDHLSQGMPIGLLSGKQTKKGLRVKATISKTTKGAEVRQLIEDKVLTKLSVGLDRSRAKTRIEDADSDSPLLVFESVPAWETSVVPLAAYNDSAKIDAVLHKTHNPKGKTHMETCPKCGAQLAAGVKAADCPTCKAAGLALGSLGDNLEALNALPATVEQLQRQIATIGDGGGGGIATPTVELGGATVNVEVPGNSYGEFLQLAARGDDKAMAFLAFVGHTTDDLVTAEWITGTWVGDLLKRLQERRRVLNLFRTRPLPAQGMTVEFGRVLSEEGVNVAEQLAEGDLLAYGKLAFEPGASSPVRTFGGWGDMSRQTIERSGVAVVEMFFEALFTRYLQVTEAAARLLAAAPVNASVAQTTAANDLTDADGWTDFIVDASFALDDNGLPLDFILVSRERFKALATMRTGPADDAPYLLDRSTGTINVTGLTGNMFGVRIEPLNLPGDFVRAGSAEAITTFESPGAPFRLQDDDITNLTKAFSLYGYAAFASTNENALIRPTEAADVAP